MNSPARTHQVETDEPVAAGASPKPERRVEVCVDSVLGALAAQRGGAHRVELCGNLAEGGTTPSHGSLELTRRHLTIPLFVMIRPRGGDFLYASEDLDVMRRDIAFAKVAGATGVVFGCLTAQGDMDLAQTRGLVALARPLDVTVHRAFDMCRDPRQALEQLIELGVERVLTSGQEAACLAGAGLIRELHRQAAGRIIVLPGGGITPLNVQQLLAETGVSEVHLSARKQVESGMKFRNDRCSMGAGSADSEYAWKTTDEATVRNVVEAVRSFG